MARIAFATHLQRFTETPAFDTGAATLRTALDAFREGLPQRDCFGLKL
jgi:hypothetical protein